jgi:hypothetical protein
MVCGDVDDPAGATVVSIVAEVIRSIRLDGLKADP